MAKGKTPRSLKASRKTSKSARRSDIAGRCLTQREKPSKKGSWAPPPPPPPKRRK